MHVPMIDPNFLRLLVCPASRQPLRPAAPAELAAANRAILGGAVRNRGGAVVSTPWADALATADSAWLYPIQDGFPILVSAEAIAAPAR
jgi:uncharacterized protein YbaR (Trm112 family)